MNAWKHLLAVLALAWGFSASATVCDTKGSCMDSFISGGNLLGELTMASTSSAKSATGTVVPISATRDDAIVVNDAIETGGFDCIGGITPDSASPGTLGASQSTGMVCTFQNSNGDTWRFTITITWFWDGHSWQIGEMSSEAKQISNHWKTETH